MSTVLLTFLVKVSPFCLTRALILFVNLKHPCSCSPHSSPISQIPWEDAISLNIWICQETTTLTIQCLCKCRETWSKKKTRMITVHSTEDCSIYTRPRSEECKSQTWICRTLWRSHPTVNTLSSPSASILTILVYRTSLELTAALWSSWTWTTFLTLSGRFTMTYGTTTPICSSVVSNTTRRTRKILDSEYPEDL